MNIGIHTCPGCDMDSVHSAEADYAELRPSMVTRNAGNFLRSRPGEQGE